MLRAGFFHKPLTTKRLRGPGPRKSLIHKHLQQKYILLNFFLYKVQKLAYYVYMKVREIKIRKTILFTKARPFKLKNKILDRKTKHKKQYEY